MPIGLLVFIVSMALATGTYGSPTQPAENQLIEQIMRQLVDAYNRKDLATIEKICDPNILSIGEGEKRIGWLAFSDHLKSDWDGLAEFYWDVQKIQVKSVVQDFAWATSEGSFKAKTQDGTQVQESTIETCIFHKKSGAWKLAHAHLSSMPMKK